jgi:D-amino peptidase
VLGDVETAVVKRAIGFHSAITSTPEAAQQLIRERTKTALQRRSSFKPYKVATPVRLDLTFKSYRPAEILAYLPIVERTSSHSVRYQARNMVDFMRFMVFVGAYTVELDP